MTNNRHRLIVVCILSMSSIVACHSPESAKTGKKNGSVSLNSPEIDVRRLPIEPGLSDPNCYLNGPVGIEAELIERINDFRSAPRMCGVQRFEAAAPVSWNLRLLNAAYRHSVEMARSNLVSQTSLDSRQLWNCLDQVGYLYKTARENIAAGQPSVEKVMLGWQRSPQHCATLMASDVSEIGVACVYKQSSIYKYYWTMNVARPMVVDRETMLEIEELKRAQEKSKYSSRSVVK